MGPLNTYEYPMDVCSEEEYHEQWQSSRLSWYCSDDFNETRLQSAFSDMGITEESDEGRLSRALQSWMPDYVITSIEPMEKPPLEPIFSGKLGKDREKLPRSSFVSVKRVPSAVTKNRATSEHFNLSRGNIIKRPQRDSKYKRSLKDSKVNDTQENHKVPNRTSRLKRTLSDDTISTHYSSLFEISSFEEHSDLNSPTPRLRRRGKPKKETKSREASPQPLKSKWVELANKRLGAFDKFMRIQNAMQIDTFGTISGQFESEAFELMDPEERRLIFKSGKQTGIRYNKELKKSGSTTTLNENLILPRKQRKLRVLSAGHKPLSKGFNVDEARQQLAKERLAAMRAKQQSGSKSSKLRRINSRLSLSARSEISSNISCTTPSMRSLSPSIQDVKPEAMWKGDKEILEMDLKRGLTSRVQKRIKSTTSALERVTGYGENNSLKKMVGRCIDFPQFVDDDYGLRPKIVQKMRISPYLSNVIREDIKVRMGRPRYHEIRVKDLEWWNRGQKLNRAHRNLKVFNWLHSLREDEFENILDMEIIDRPPQSRDEAAVMHLEAADEPDIKPLYQTDFFR